MFSGICSSCSSRKWKSLVHISYGEAAKFWLANPCWPWICKCNSAKIVHWFHILTKNISSKSKKYQHTNKKSIAHLFHYVKFHEKKMNVHNQGDTKRKSLESQDNESTIKINIHYQNKHCPIYPPVPQCPSFT